MTTMSTPIAPSHQRTGTLRVVAAVGCLLAAIALSPTLTQGAPFMLVLASHAAIAAILALSLDLLTGNVGLLTFGQAAWYGFGAYVAGLLAKTVSPEILIVLPLTAAASAMVATLIGAILVRQVGKTFAILTLAFSQIMFSAVFVFPAITGGEDGLQGIPIPRLLGYPVRAPEVWFWLLYSFLLLALAVALYVRKSPMGKTGLAIRENPERARFIGLNVLRFKLAAYVTSAVLAAAGGGLFALFTGSASPDLLHWSESGKILMYAVLGGVGTLIGPVVGGIIFTVAEHYVSSWLDSWLIVFGALFVFSVIVAPGGIFGSLQAMSKRFSQTK